MSEQCAWPIVRLGDIIRDAAYGTSVKCSDNPEGVPVLRMGNVRYDGSLDLSNLKYAHFSQSEWSKFGLNAGDILFNRTNSKELVGKTGLWDGRFKAAAASYFIRVRVDIDRVLPVWVWWFLNSPQMKERLFATARGAIGQANINGEELKAFPIPLPSLTEQQRIVDILNNAASIRQLRDEARAKVRELVPALFVEMFGDPATNPRGWPITTFGQVTEVQGGLQVTKARQRLPLELPYLRVANVHRNRLDLQEIKTIRLTAAERERVRLVSGDLLIVEGHGNPDEIGRVAVWDGSISECVHQNHLIRARCRTNKIHPMFLSSFLNSASGRQELLRLGKTTSGLNTISVSNVKAISTLLPPLTLQQQFADRVAEIEATATLSDKAATAAEQLTHSLLAQAFGRMPYRQSVEA